MRLSFRMISLLTALIFLCPPQVKSQWNTSAYEKYIKQYSNIAVKHQKEYHIPASITLAQGLLESGAGLSELARESNNHFGIKCHADWRGARVYHDDDARGECFRKYNDPEESYEDHAHFLADRPRYSTLFTLDIRDYQGWARGLQQCGYATDRAYANRLIKIIEDYELYRFDSQKESKRSYGKQPKVEQIGLNYKYTVYITHGLLYVYSNGRDSFDDIANALGFKAKNLRKYNEVPEDFPLKKDDIVYLEKKKKKADKPDYDHVVQVGESMHSISQMYGIQIKSLYKLNKKDKEYIPAEGDVLKLR